MSLVWLYAEIDLLTTNASGWLNSLGLLIVVEDTSLTGNVLDSLTVDVVDSGDVVCDIGVVLVLVCDDSLCVQVVSVDCCDDGLVVLMMDVVLNDECLACGKVLLDRLVDDNVVVLNPS